VVGVVAFAFDLWTYRHLHADGVYDSDLGRLSRIVGYWPTWGIAAIALWLHDRRTSGTLSDRAFLLAGAPAVAGIVGEIVKLLVRRDRPGMHGGAYAFRAFTDRPWSTVGLGMPSSHAAVAFGAAAALSRLFPGARPVWYALAFACGLTRLLARAHFLSDVFVGAAIGVATAAALWRVVDTTQQSAAASSRRAAD
jgi:membrane-associated phospholipid phosphatase